MTATVERAEGDGQEAGTIDAAQPDVAGPGPASGAPARSAPASQPHRAVLAALDEAPSGLVVTGLDDEGRAVLVRGLRRAGRQVLVVAASVADATTWRRDLGEPDAPTHDVEPGFSGTEDEIAELLAVTADADRWLVELVGPAGSAGDTAPPLAAAELAELRRLLVAEHGPDAGLDPSRRHQPLPPPAELPPEAHVEQVADELLDVVGPASSSAREDARLLVAALACLPPKAAGALEAVLYGIDEGVVALGRVGDEAGWARYVVDGILAGRFTTAWERVEAVLPALEQVPEHDRGSGSAQVRITGEIADLGVAAEAFARYAAFLDQGGTLRRMFKSDEQREVEQVLPAIVVDRVDPNTAEGAAAVSHHLWLRQYEAQLTAGLARLGRAVQPADQRALLVHRLLSWRELGLRIGAVVDAVGQLRTLLAELPAAVRPTTDGLPTLGRVVATGRRLIARAGADSARRELGDVVARLNRLVPPTSGQAPELRAALAALYRLDVTGYARAADAADLARDEERDLRRSDSLVARLADQPALLEALDVDTSDETWQPREEGWPQAWAHRGALAWLTARSPGPVTTTVALAEREETAAVQVDLVVLGPLRDGQEPPAGWGEKPDRVVDVPGSSGDDSRLWVLPVRPDPNDRDG